MERDYPKQAVRELEEYIEKLEHISNKAKSDSDVQYPLLMSKAVACITFAQNIELILKEDAAMMFERLEESRLKFRRKNFDDREDDSTSNMQTWKSRIGQLRDSIISDNSSTSFDEPVKE